MMKPHYLTLVAAVLAGPSTAVAQTYAVTDLGVVTGASYSYPKAINDASGTIRVVGYTRDTRANWYHGFQWDASQGIKDLGTLVSGGTSSAEAVNSQGEVVGWSGNSSAANRVAVYRNFRTGGALTQLPYPPGFLDGVHVASSSAAAISDTGIVVGNIFRDGLGSLAVCWQRDGTGAWQCQVLQQLYPTPSTGNNAGASAINAAGDIAGYVTSQNATVPGSSYRAVVWKNLGTPNYGTPTDEGLPPDSGDWPSGQGAWSESSCGFINSAGVTAGGYGESGGRFFWSPGNSPVTFTAGFLNSLSDPNSTGLSGAAGRYYNTAGVCHAFIADTSGGFVDLGILTGGTSSQGNGISVVGGSFQVVGWASTRNGPNHAFIWTGSLKDLNSVTTGLGTFSYLSVGDRITNSGNIAAEGVTTKGSYTHAALLKRL